VGNRDLGKNSMKSRANWKCHWVVHFLESGCPEIQWSCCVFAELLTTSYIWIDS